MIKFGGMIGKLIGSVICLAIFLFMLGVVGGGGHGQIQFRPHKTEDWIIFGGMTISLLVLVWIWFGNVITEWMHSGRKK